MQNTNNSRSCEGYYRKSNPDLDPDLELWFRISSIDYEKLAGDRQFLKIIKSFENDTIKLLDIGCGTGVFPGLLDKQIERESNHTGIRLSSDLLDIAEYCLDRCSSAIERFHFFDLNEVFLSSIEDIATTIPRSSCYDMIWAIHSFYTVDIDKIKAILQHIRILLKSDGIFLIFQASLDSCYARLHNFYLENYKQPNYPKRFLTAEDIQETLNSLEVKYDTIDFDYTHEIDREEREVLKVYLEKCVLDDSADVLALFKEELLKYFKSQSDRFIFKQKTKLIVVRKS